MFGAIDPELGVRPLTIRRVCAHQTPKQRAVVADLEVDQLVDDDLGPPLW